MTTVVTRLFDTYDHAAQAVADLESAGIAHDQISMVASNSEGRHGPTGTAGSMTTDPLLGGAGATGLPTTGLMGAAPVAGTPILDTPMVDAGASAMPMSPAPIAGTMGTTSGYTDPAVVDPEATGAGAGTGASLGTVLGGGAGLLAGLGMLAIPGVGPVVAAGWLISTLVGAGVGAGAGGLLGSLVGAGVDEGHAHVFAEGVRRGGTVVTVRAPDDMRAMVEEVLARHSPVDAASRGADYRASGWEKFDETAPAYAAGGSPTIGTATTPTGEPAYRPGSLS